MEDIPLFPLNTVLFPGGLLPLRIFEARYLDMIGRCMRGDAVFGVVLIREGSDTSRSVATEAVGTSARIIDFQALAGGLLGLLCRGERRFAIRQHSRQQDGLNRATVEWMREAPQMPLEAPFQPLIPVLRRVMARLERIDRFLEPQYDDASWVGYRLAELLPLEPPLQQQLLEMDDPNARLRLLAPLIETRSPPD